MNCLCCGKPLSAGEGPGGWHRRCVRRFFGTSVLPDIALDSNTLEQLALQSTDKGFTVPGVQKKLSLHLLSPSGEMPRLTLVDYPTGYILKPQVDAFKALPEAEQLVMSMAGAAGISTVPHALIPLGDSLAYITKRVDRVFAGNSVKMLAMEDFCQLDMRLTQDKYKGSYERCAKIIRQWSSRCGLDMTELFMRIVFSYITGNSDMHLKNFSLLETGEDTGEYILSPAYDLLPVNVIMPEDLEEMALALNGKKAHLTKNDFLAFAAACGIDRAPAVKMIAKLVSLRPLFAQMCARSLLPSELSESLAALMETRCSVLA